MSSERETAVLTSALEWNERTWFRCWYAHNILSVACCLLVSIACTTGRSTYYAQNNILCCSREITKANMGKNAVETNWLRAILCIRQLTKFNTHCLINCIESAYGTLGMHSCTHRIRLSHYSTHRNTQLLCTDALMSRYNVSNWEKKNRFDANICLFGLINLQLAFICLYISVCNMPADKI